MFNKVKDQIIELRLYNDSKFPEYQAYHLPKELDIFLQRINKYSEKGWKIILKKTSYIEMLGDLQDTGN